ncbi:MAG: single-stranded-DNA-specific exonuclease RecJ [Alphaproteobacteria bacterium]|nr:single-stranded-DNA-specific exonuclease RecJ [Alphaproteobacteria bacterium]
MTISVLRKNWQQKQIDERMVYRFINDHNLSDILARIIIGREIKIDEVENFINPKIKNLLPDPFHLLDMEKACRRVYRAMTTGQKIMILGDYDVDGATSTALLKRLFRDIGVDCDIYIPDRILDGYGPSASLMAKFKDMKIDLVITVDCGITAFDAMEYANSIGLDVIILDHHLSEAVIPNAYAVVNPNRVDESSEYITLAAVGVSFLFAVGLVKILKENNYFLTKQPPNLLSMLDLVALGTVCDMMPITGLNRAFVNQGLKVMQQEGNIGLKILAEFGKVDGKISAYHLGFIIGPRINAGGRVGQSYLGARLLSDTDINKVYEYASSLELFNEERKSIENAIAEEAINMAEEQKDGHYIMIASDKWHQGVIGVVASKLKEKYQKPVMVISIENGIGKASCRSVRGINLGQKIAKAKGAGLLISGGGHAMAAGFSVKEEKIRELKDFMDKDIAQNADAFSDNMLKYYDAIISPGGATTEFAMELEKLEPYGIGNQEPLILIEGLYVLKAKIASNKHISCLLAPDSNSFGKKPLSGICFNAIGTEIEDIIFSKKSHKLNVVCNLKINRWQGEVSPQIIISDLIIA